MNADLHALGLAAKWPKLAKLHQDRAKFQRRELGHERLRRAIGGGGGKL